MIRNDFNIPATLNHCHAGNEQVARLVRPCLVPKNFRDFSSHRMLGHIHGALNVDRKKTNYTVW
jgi:hypothetical protein